VGTDQSDSIRVSQSIIQLQRARPRARLSVPSIVVDGVGTFRAQQIQRVVIFAGGGDDSVQIVDSGRRRLTAIVDAGFGNDAVIGGFGNDAIQGGYGDDVIWGGGGRNRLDGGAGWDTVNGTSEPIAAPVIPVSPAPSPIPGPSPSTPSLSDYEAQIVSLVNQERQSRGLATLMINSRLQAAARLQAQQMADAGIMAHELPGASFPGLIDRIRHVGYAYRMAGENIAVGYRNAVSVMQAWMNSEGHRENILERGYRELGVAIVANARGDIYYCQVFGEPA
jgi:uncharacterized protein YkwD